MTTIYPKPDFYVGSDSNSVPLNVTGVREPVYLLSGNIQLVNSNGEQVTMISDDSSLSEDLSTYIPTQKAVKAYVDGTSGYPTATLPLYISAGDLKLVNGSANTVTEVSTDGAMTDNSDTKIATQKALVTYVAPEKALVNGTTYLGIDQVAHAVNVTTPSGLTASLGSSHCTFYSDVTSTSYVQGLYFRSYDPSSGVGWQVSQSSGILSFYYIYNLTILQVLNLASSSITAVMPLSISNATDATALDTGALQVTGGASISKTLYVGTGAHIYGTMYIKQNVADTTGIRFSTDGTSLDIYHGTYHLLNAAPSAYNIYQQLVCQSTISSASVLIHQTGPSLTIRDEGSGISWSNSLDTSGVYWIKRGTTPVMKASNATVEWYIGSTTIDTITATQKTLNIPLSMTDTTDTTGAGVGSFQLAGGAYVAKKIISGSTITATDTLTVTGLAPQLTLNETPANLAYTIKGDAGSLITYIGGTQTSTLNTTYLEQDTQEIIATTTANQLIVAYNPSNALAIDVSSSGNASLTPSGGTTTLVGTVAISANSSSNSMTVDANANVTLGTARWKGNCLFSFLRETTASATWAQIGTLPFFGWRYNVGNSMGGAWQVGHDVMTVTQYVYLSIHWLPSNTNTGNVHWQIQFNYAAPGGTHSSTMSTADIIVAAPGTTYAHVDSYSSLLTLTGLVQGGQFLFLLNRVNDASDTYTGTPYLTGCCMHYQSVNLIGDSTP